MAANLINILANTIDLFFRLLSFLIIAKILMSWVAPHAGGQIAQLIHSTTEPVLAPFRRLGLRIGMIDLSPIAALIALDFGRYIVLSLLFGLA